MNNKTKQILLIDGQVVAQSKFDKEFAVQMKAAGSVTVKHSYSHVLDQYSTDIVSPSIKAVKQDESLFKSVDT